MKKVKAGMDGSVRLKRASRNVIISESMDKVWGTKNLFTAFLLLPAAWVYKSGSSILKLGLTCEFDGDYLEALNSPTPHVPINPPHAADVV